jgi:hypothetical protein
MVGDCGRARTDVLVARKARRVGRRNCIVKVGRGGWLMVFLGRWEMELC